MPTLEIFGKSLRRLDEASRLTRRLRRAASAIGYAMEYLYFTTACFLLSLYVLCKEGFNVIHLHNPPNSPFLICLLYRMCGKKFVFDHHDLAPELYLSRHKVTANWIYRALLLEEALCLRSANLIIATNESYKRIDAKRGRRSPEEIVVVRNGPDLKREHFDPVEPDKALKAMGRTIGVYVGAIGPQDGLDHLVRAVDLLVHQEGRRDFYCVILGAGDDVPYLKRLCSELQLDDYVWFAGYVPRADLVRYLSTADICLDPNPSSPLNDHSTWIKVLEYMAFGKPIVSFDLTETRYSAGDAAVYVPPNDDHAYAKAIMALMDNPEQRARMGRLGWSRVRESLAWEHVSKNLVEAYDRLFGFARPGVTSVGSASRAE
jgi:glycosyltransferase involved in cell wall biosynthesis